MHPPEGVSHYGACLIAAGQSAKRTWRYHKAQKHVAPQPKPYTEKLDCPQKSRHGSPEKTPKPKKYPEVDYKNL
jgi:hypothetical protein